MAAAVAEAAAVAAVVADAGATAEGALAAAAAVVEPAADAVVVEAVPADAVAVAVGKPAVGIDALAGAVVDAAAAAEEAEGEAVRRMRHAAGAVVQNTGMDPGWVERRGKAAEWLRVGARLRPEPGTTEMAHVAVTRTANTAAAKDTKVVQRVPAKTRQESKVLT